MGIHVFRDLIPELSLVDIQACTNRELRCKHTNVLTLTHTPTSPHTPKEALFVNLAFGLKGYQDILKAEEKQKSKPAREESRGRRKPLSPSI